MNCVLVIPVPLQIGQFDRSPDPWHFGHCMYSMKFDRGLAMSWTSLLVILMFLVVCVVVLQTIFQLFLLPLWLVGYVL